MEPGDWAAVRRIYSEVIATGHATLERAVPDQRTLDHAWLPEHRWIAEINGQVIGWVAAAPVSNRPAFAGVAETQLYIGDGFRSRGVGKALIRKQVYC
jgi:L-amino acid N-acyltransferase YncA